MTDRLNLDQTLMPGQSIKSNNGKAELVMQGDGNLVLYEAVTGGGRVLWATDTWNIPGAAGSRVVMQDDGNLVIYTPNNQPIWDSGTWKVDAAGACLVVQDDGNLVIYAADGRAVWASDTSLGGLGGPQHISNEWHHPNGFHMAGDGYLTAQGQLRVDITTWTSSWGLGFTGGGILAVIDAGENVIHKFEVWPLGVDARGVLWSRSRRTDHMDTQIDPALAAQAARIELWLGHMPKNRWDQIMAETRQKVEDLKRLYDDLLQATA